MTQIEIYRNSRGEIVKYLVAGHTGYGESGTDIVCASVTTAALTALNGLTEIVGIPVGYEVREGYLECVLPEQMEDAARRGANLLLESMCLTLRELARQYEDYISIAELEV